MIYKKKYGINLKKKSIKWFTYKSMIWLYNYLVSEEKKYTKHQMLGTTKTN